jgi:secondary thiamine-phosphate synthase enzyme
MVVQRKLSFSTEGNTDIINLTPLIEQEINHLGISDGIISIFAPGATGAVTTIEYEPGLINDFKKIVEKIIPREGFYQHNQRWGDDNAHSHLRASLVGPSLAVPFSRKQLSLGTWQQIIFVDFDVRPRKRTLILQIIGE